MTLLDRDLAGDFLKTLLSLLALFAIIFLADTVVGLFSVLFASEQNLLHWAALYYLLRLPSFLIEAGAIAVAAAVLWVAAQKSRTNETLAWLAGGISPRRLAVPIIVTSCLLAAGAIVAQEWFAARGEQRAEYIEWVMLEGRDPAELATDKQIYQKGRDNRVYLIDRFDTVKEEMVNPTIIDVYEDTRRPKMILAAEFARPVSDEPGNTEWEFVNAVVREFDAGGTISGFYREALLPMELEPRVSGFVASIGDPEEMTSRELWNYISLIEEQGKDTTQLRALLHQKIALPFGIAVMGLLMCAHALTPRSRAALVGFGGGLAWIAFYYVVVVICRKAAEADVALPPLLTGWLPNALFGAYGMFALLRGPGR